MVKGTAFDHPMAVNSAPGGDVLQHAGIRADHFQNITRFHMPDFVLGADNGQRAKQAAGVQGFCCHKMVGMHCTSVELIQIKISAHFTMPASQINHDNTYRMPYRFATY